MSRFLRNTFVIFVVLLVGAALASAQDAVSLVEFMDGTFGVQGVRPDGWMNVQPGIHVRGGSGRDVTLLAVQAAPLSVQSLWPALLPQFGLQSPPESIGALTTEAFEWQLYQFEVTQAGITVAVDLALAEQDGTTYIVLVQSDASEQQALYDQVFMPVVESLKPFVEDTASLPYTVEEVAFANGEVTLAGTLTLPEGDGPHPAVVLMTGSGPQDRDEQVAGFAIFRTIADYLTRQGSAVLRYDDRGVGQSSGEWASAGLAEFAADGKAAVAYLQTRDDINAEQVGVLGHSIGGALAAILGADPESGLAFIVSMAGPGVDGQVTLVEQNKIILAQQGATPEQIDSQIAFLEASFPLIEARDWEAYEDLMDDTLVEQWDLLTDEQRESTGLSSAEEFAELSAANGLATVSNEEFITLMAYDPAPDWEKTTVPVLALFGEFDLQVPPVLHAPALEAALEASGNSDVTVVVIEGANHLFQATETGAIEEYAQLPPEFVPDFLPTISNWILERVSDS
ncbi:MAG: alpha/beta fold hydrolase [Chloroflexi bacterium]|nr:alpha/beta fold hydrolase [Chloroflexota bacterium]